MPRAKQPSKRSGGRPYKPDPRNPSRPVSYPGYIQREVDELDIIPRSPRKERATSPLLSPDEIKRESPEIDLSTPPPYTPGTQPPRFRASKQNAPPRSHPEHESSISVRSELRRIHGRRVRVLTFGRIQQVPTSPRGVKRPHSDAFPLTEATTTGLAKKTGPRHSLLPLLL